ncbi:MAG: tetratricopeptide repeat protein [Treponema sp.]|nr:tetratricopeptide repeat protein [Treponema sp.]
MLSIFKRFFKKKVVHAESDVLIADFTQNNFNLFPQHNGDGYNTFYDNGFILELYRKDLFAWSVSEENQFKDSVIEAIIDFSQINVLIPDNSENLNSQENAGFTSLGLLFRYINEGNFYSVLISDHGFFRIDTIFNNNQMPIIGWTKIPKINENPNQINLKIVANGTKFSLIINNKTAINFEDDTIQSEGYIAFAAQNYNMFEKIRGKLIFLSVDPRDIFIDAAYRQWSNINEISADTCRNNAHSYSAVGNYVGAMLELENIWKKEEPSIDDLLFGTRLYLAKNMFDNAEKLILQALKIDSSSISVQEQYASFLYLSGKNVALEKYLSQIDIEKSSLLLTFAGHSFFALNDFEKALDNYSKASVLEKNQGMHKINCALCYEKLNKKAKSFELRYEAAHLFLEQKKFNDFSTEIAILENSKLTTSQITQLKFLKGKFFFLQNNFTESIIFIEDFLKEAKSNNKNFFSQSHFMLSKIYCEQNNAQKAIEHAKLSCDFNDASSKIILNYAELLFATNKLDEAKKITQKACDADNQNAHAWNLLCSIELKQGNLDNAFEAVFTALSILPEDLSVLKNYIFIMQKKERFEEAIGVLDAVAKHSGYGSDYRSQALHFAGNLLRDCEKYDEAESYYKEALTLTPKNQQLLVDYASLCIQTDRLNEADSILSSTISDDTTPSEYVVRLLASISVKKGDYSRSEVLLRKTIEITESNNASCGKLYLDLGNLYLGINKIDKAEEILNILSEDGYTDEFNELQLSINEKTKDKISCFNCNETWFVPKNISEMGKLQLTAQPPDNLPAGNCPKCGKVFCIGCAKKTLDNNGRFRCMECNEFLKLQNKSVAYLLYHWMRNETK